MKEDTVDLDERADATKPYGDVTYADPGYQKDKKKRYPLDTREHAKAAWSYINQSDNAGQYSAEDLKKVKTRIMAACKKFGVEVEGSMMGGRSMAGVYVTRSFGFESRASGDGRTLEGYAAVFDTPSRIAARDGDFDEVIRPGAFRRSLERRTPVLQFEHGRDPRVGAVPIGSIEDIGEDTRGLRVRATLFDNPVVEPVRQAIAGGAIKGMSFRFMVPDGGDKWSRRHNDVDLREVLDTDTAECGPVVFPAYDTTTVSVRSLLAQLDPQEYETLIRELRADILRLADLPDLTAATDTRSAGGGADDEPGNGAASTTITRSRFAADGESLALRGIL